MNCTDARVECCRVRQARVHRPRVSRYVSLTSYHLQMYLTINSLEALSDRLAKLEKSNEGTSVFSSPSPAIGSNETNQTVSLSPRTKPIDATKLSSKRKVHSDHVTNEISPSRPHETKRKILQNIVTNIHGERHLPGSARHASEAREYIEHELQCNPALSKDRRMALEMAQKFVSQLSNPGIHRYETAAAEELEILDIAPPNFTPELLYMMLPGSDKKTSSQGTIVWPDHISEKTLERMGLAIIERSESEQVLQLYRISVWVKAISFISKLAPFISSQPLKVHFRTLKKQYEIAAIEELNSVPLTASPSLTLLQALLSGKRLMQYLGNMSRCWMFTAHASRVIVALNYHNINNPIPQNEVEEDIHACVYTCYYFDKTLGLLLLRPPSLPELKVEPAQLIHLDPEIPTTAMIGGIVELARLKNTLLQVLLDTKETSDKDKASLLSDLVVRAQKIHFNLQLHRSRQEIEFSASWPILRREWLSMDFNYYSILTTIIRARSSVLKSRLVCEDCLYAAREALITLRALQEAFSTDEISVNSYPYFLTWYVLFDFLPSFKIETLNEFNFRTMLLFPLSPFFVLFCNVVATSDHRDFEMIKEITGNLRQFAKANASIGKLYGLFSKFLDLCTPLIKERDIWSSSEETEPSFPGGVTGGREPAQLSPYTEMFSRASDHALNTLPNPGPSRAVSDVPQSVPSVEGWGDNLMWELFDNQPSLGWAESELWDTITQLNTT
ncbi:transcriptional regulator family: Fungal Specific TF [Penicillium odoratum]|uniref:transcriptional regulator family: Fungal Specific TF n=1 Tax=Penicillium odoratum TaxID=1167516 RepID=UPI0025476F2F|nr:transcriptional regulator family: Fungal Specific TF [Penicillium odoratum]KAJ5772212.1 transcriptional regulator family: Fungal Specific TF [Penicillium odoratum]